MTSVQDLRKIYSAQGIKGFSSANRAAFNADIEAAELAAYAEDAERAPKPVATPKRGICTECGRKEDFRASGLCADCRSYGEWENTHSDSNHDADPNAEDKDDCPVCHPELDPRKPKSAGRSRAGMVIVAKGSEIHKSNTFKVAAEAAGWTVSVLGSVTTDRDGEEIERFVARATKGDQVIELAWNGRAYDYPSSSAILKGKNRKVRNLKEALRFL